MHDFEYIFSMVSWYGRREVDSYEEYLNAAIPVSRDTGDGYFAAGDVTKRTNSVAVNAD